MPTQALPEPEAVQSVLLNLLGRDVSVRRVTPEAVAIDATPVIGCYERNDGKIGGLVACDLEIAAYAGASLSLIPPAMARESINDGVLEESLLENFQEVINVGVTWFNGKGVPRVVLAEVYPPNAKLPDDVRLILAAPNDRADYEVEISGYGSGRLRFLVMDF